MSQKIELFIVTAVRTSNPMQLLVNFSSENEFSDVARVTEVVRRNREMICTSENAEVSARFSVLLLLLLMF
jgi:hypothetical protein